MNNALAHDFLEVIQPRWHSCVVCAPGPSLTEEVADKVQRSGLPIIACQDAYKRVKADVLFACDARWWSYHQGAPDFKGEKWSTHELPDNDKTMAHGLWGVRCVRGQEGHTFSLDPSVLNYGDNSGHQSIGLAILFGCSRVWLHGFDMRHVDGQAHYFGNHPEALSSSTNYRDFIPAFEHAAKALPRHITIVNLTPNSALKCFSHDQGA